jgi:predicted anti-sigma-YlaC factor YlaD
MLKITCQHASRLLSQELDQPLGLRKRIQLRVHLSICDACRNVSRQFSAMRLALQVWRDRD